MVWGIAMMLVAYSGGPPDGVTGAPGEGLCSNAGCHSGGDVTGMTVALSSPWVLNPGDTVSMFLTVTHPTALRWGFELTILDDQGNRAGALIVSDPTRTQLSSTASRDYLKHTASGTFTGQPDSAIWTFRWLVPALPQVTLYVAANAADNNGFPSGDAIFATAIPLTITAVTERPGSGPPRLVVVPGGLRVEGRRVRLLIFRPDGRKVADRVLAGGRVISLPRGVYTVIQRDEAHARVLRVVIP